MIRQIAHTFLFIFLFSSVICAQWFQQSTNTSHALHYIEAANEFTSYSAGKWNTLLKTTDSGNTWMHLSTFNYFPINSIFFINNETGWTVGTNGKIFKTNNGGAAWIDQSIQQEYSLHTVFFINKDTGWVAGTKNNACILKTTDGGDSWYEQFIGNFFSPVFYSIQFLNSECGWVVGSHGKVMKTTNGGIDWSFSFTGYSFEYYSVSFINDSTGWIISSDYYSGPGGGYPFGTIFFTNDGGNTWEYQAEIMYCILNEVIALNSEKAFIVGSKLTLDDYEGVIFFTTNTGNNWSDQISEASFEFFSISFSDSLNGWICGADGVILHTTNGGVTFIDDENNFTKPMDFHLSQNYPNPFNPTTTIKYQIPEISFVTINVYDVLGKEVATLLNEEKPAGSYEVEFNGDGLTSGVYFYRLQAGSFVETKKMVLLK